MRPVARRGTIGRVLVVDDEQLVARVLTRVLESAGYEVHTCFDGASALNCIRDASFDVVLSDVSMPGLDGVDLLRAVRGTDLDLPVVLITGTPSMDSALGAVEYGALRYLQKPVETAVLCDTIERAVGLRRVALLRRELSDTLGSDGRQLSDRAGLEVRFERASSELYVVFQPVISWSARHVIAYEAFVRSRERTLGRPADLFDAAERLGKLSELRRQIHTLCAERLDELPPDALLFLNLHLDDLIHTGHLEQWSPLLGSADRIILEITERAPLEQVPELPLRILQLRGRGFRIALDNVGAGYAGLGSFTMLEPDMVKIDMSLVRRIDSSAPNCRLMTSMTQACTDLGMRVIAEGIETHEERDTLVELGCDLLQGYLFGRPEERFSSPRLEGP